MTDNVMRMAIAEACGWVRDDVCDNWKKPSEGPYAIAFLNGSYHHRQLPDYLNDLNAMHEAEITLDAKLDYGSSRSAFFAWLLVATGKCTYFDDARYLAVDAFMNGDIVSATARQRAEAFLRTIGKLKD